MLQSAATKIGIEIIPTWRLGRLPFAAHLKRLFAKHDIRCVLDVGANRGQFRDFLREEVGFGGTIVSFEPLRSMFVQLEDKARLDPKWKPINVALGPADGHMSLNVMAATEFASFLTPNPKGPQYKDNVVVATENVTVRRLDSIVPEIQSQLSVENPYLKLDTQGYDLRVIAGAGSYLDSVRALQTEMSVLPIYEEMPSFEEALSVLRKRGFDITGMFPVCEDGKMRLVEFDCVMLNRAFAYAY